MRDPVRHWSEIIGRVDALDSPPLDDELLARLAAPGVHRDGIDFYTPTFKTFATSELSATGRNDWPAVSVTGSACRLQCDHCRARVLEPMIPATTPDALRRVIERQVAEGARGLLLTGGSDRDNRVDYGPFLPELRRIKETHPGFRIAVHTALLDEAAARGLEEAGVDVAMMDLIGDEETIRRVYHLDRPVEAFERTLEVLAATGMRVVPHIVIGLHYGELRGEWRVLEMLERHRPDAVVLVVVMPYYASAKRPFRTPDPHAVGRFFLDARQALPGLPLQLGCARPAGVAKQQLDIYAVLAGLDGIAHPADGIVELAARLGRRVRVTPACCSVATVPGLDGEGMAFMEPDLAAIVAGERRARIGGIPVVSAAAGVR